MKKSALLLFSLIVLLFISPKESFAATFFDQPIPSGSDYQVVSNSFCSGPDQCANTYTTSRSNSACGLYGCGGGLNWTKYELTCVEYQPPFGDPTYDEYYNPAVGERVYSIGDKCIGGETGLRLGFCDGSYGITYKRCCSGFTPVSCTQATSVFQDGIYPDEGACPSGSTETAPGVTSCPDVPPPPPTNHCAEAGYTACTPGSATGGSCINSSGQECTAYSRFACSFEGQNYCDPNNPTCGAPCSAPPPPPPASCSVSWNISNTNPAVNSTVNVTVNGSATPNWNGSSYSLDGGGWNNVSSGPPFSFNVSSGSPGIHTLRFSTGNGSTICSSSGVNSFSTQSPNNGANCTSYRVNNENAVSAGDNIPIAITMQNGSGNFTTWTSTGANPYRLGAQQMQDSPNWGTASGASSGKGNRPTRVDLSQSPVPPGGTANFNFNATAPNTPGTYRLSFQMLQEGVTWFGGLCQRDITVQPSSFTTTCNGTITSQANRTVQWTANPSPAGSYTYSWSGDDGLSGFSQTISQTYATAGVKNAQVTLTSFGLTRSANCAVAIPAPFDFSLSNGGSKTVARGSAVNNSVIATLSSGATQSVSFSALGFPSGVTHSFSPTICNPTCSSTLNMAASSTATIGSSTITVTGTAGSLTKTTPFTLTVTTPPPSCGNGTCNPGESCSTCSADCGLCPAPPPPPPVGPPPPPPAGPPPPGGCPWIQTTGGDVHSNTGINTPCGP